MCVTTMSLRWPEMTSCVSGRLVGVVTVAISPLAPVMVVCAASEDTWRVECARHCASSLPRNALRNTKQLDFENSPPFLNLRESAVTYIAAHRMPRDYRDDRRDHDRSCDRHGGDDRRHWDRGGEYQRRDDRRDDRDRRNPRHRSRSRSPGRYGRDHPDSARDGRGAQDRRYDDQRHAQTTTEPAPTKRSEVRARGELNHAIPSDVSGFFNDLYARAPFPS